MNSLVVGVGEVGTAVRAVTGSKYYHDTFQDIVAPSIDYDVMHICFPYSEGFVEAVREYMVRFKPKHVVVWSTVPVGTCRSIDEKVAHSPVEGTHPHLEDSIKRSRRWLGFNDGMEGAFFTKYFNRLELNVYFVTDTETTELAKLRSTAKFGVNLVWADYEAELCKRFNVSYGHLMDYDIDYNGLYQDEPYVQRYVLYPPNGKIGGHCVVPNAKLLNEQAPNDLLDKIIAMEKK